MTLCVNRDLCVCCFGYCVCLLFGVVLFRCLFDFFVYLMMLCAWCVVACCFVFSLLFVVVVLYLFVVFVVCFCLFELLCFVFIARCLGLCSFFLLSQKVGLLVVFGFVVLVFVFVINA